MLLLVENGPPVLLMGPIGSVFGGILAGVDWGVSMGQLLLKEGVDGPEPETKVETRRQNRMQRPPNRPERRKRRRRRKQTPMSWTKYWSLSRSFWPPRRVTNRESSAALFSSPFCDAILCFLALLPTNGGEHVSALDHVQRQSSRPWTIIVDDYPAYWWLSDNTPEDSSHGVVGLRLPD